jgi:PKD repeat protein
VVEFNNTSTPGCTYFWDFGAGFTSADANPSHDFLYDNTWPVQLIVSNECGSDTLDTMIVVIKNNIADIEASNLSISEQAGTLTILSNNPFEKGTLLSLNNLSGQLIGSKTQASANQNSMQLSTQQLPAGIYFITLQSSSKQQTLKWLKMNN